MTNETMQPVPTEPAVPAVGPQVPAVPSAKVGGNLDEFFASIRRTGLVRSRERWIGGVAGGIANRMGWDPMLVRGVLFISTFLTGLGLVLYGLGWALLPDESDGRIHLQEALRGRFNVALLGAAFAVLAGLNRNNGLVGFGHWFAVISNVITSALLVVGGIYVLRLVRDRRTAAAITSDAATITPDSPVGTSDFPVGVNAGETPIEPVSPRIATAVLPVDDESDESLAASIVGATSVGTASVGAPSVYAAGTPSVDAASRAFEESSAYPDKAAQRYAKALARANTPVVRGPGAGYTGAVLGVLMLLAATGMALAHFQIAVPGPLGSPLAWLGAGLTIIGGATVLAGVRGRRGGLLNTLAIFGLLAIPAAGIAVVSTDATDPSIAGTEIVIPTFGGRGNGPSANVENATRIGDGAVVVTNRSEAERGFRARVGDPVIDLTGLDMSQGTTPITVPISLQAGDLTVIVPDDAAVAANVRLLAGEISWDVDGTDQTLSQVGRRRVRLESEEVQAGRPELTLVVDMVAGNLTVRERH